MTDEKMLTKKELDNLERGLKKDHPNDSLNSYQNMFKYKKMKRIIETTKNVLHENGGHI